MLIYVQNITNKSTFIFLQKILLSKKRIKIWARIRSYKHGFYTKAFSNPCQVLPSRHLLVQIQQSKQQNNVWSLFKVNDKDIRTKSMMSLLCIYYQIFKDFTCCPSPLLLWTSKYGLHKEWITPTYWSYFHKHWHESN